MWPGQRSQFQELWHMAGKRFSYRSVKEAVHAARNGDKVLLEKGIHNGLGYAPYCVDSRAVTAVVVTFQFPLVKMTSPCGTARTCTHSGALAAPHAHHHKDVLATACQCCKHISKPMHWLCNRPHTMIHTNRLSSSALANPRCDCESAPLHLAALCSPLQRPTWTVLHVQSGCFMGLPASAWPPAITDPRTQGGLLFEGCLWTASVGIGNLSC